MSERRTSYRAWLERALTVGAAATVVWFYAWTVRTSGGFNPPGEEDYYNFLVRGWRQGHLYMAKEPRPELLALADPYDPAQNNAVRMGDASYFRGHYYLYFGAGPAALLMLPFDLLTGREMGTTTAIFVFCVTGFLAAAGLWLAVRRRYFPASVWWLGPLGVLTIGLGSHVLALARRPLVWELPIAAGFAFSMLALVGAYAALHGRRPVVAVGLTALSIGLAVTARPTCVLGSVLLVPIWWQLRREGTTWRSAGAAAVGLGIGVGAVLTHNFARFGDAFEFGQNFQLSGVYESKMRHFSVGYLAHNATIYFFHPAEWTRSFPFLAATAVHDGGLPGYLGDWNEAVCGLAVTFPIVWLALAAPLGWRGRPVAEAGLLRALTLAIAIFWGAMMTVMLCYFVATPRYLADFAPSLALLAMFGALGLERWLHSHGWHRTAAVALVLPACLTTAAGVALSFDYHDRLLRKLQPQLWANLERAFTPGQTAPAKPADR